VRLIAGDPIGVALLDSELFETTRLEGCRRQRLYLAAASVGAGLGFVAPTTGIVSLPLSLSDSYSHVTSGLSFSTT
jgi:hypothetical protein